jgi:alkylhydroperoxidase family enzyme
MHAGASEDKIRVVEQFAESPLYSPAERAALAYAEAMTITGRTVDDALFERVREHFAEPQIVELTAAIALENFRSKFNVALGIAAQGFCSIR